jgi:hypothetical protein
MTVSVTSATCWDVATCSLVDIYHCFGGEYCLHFQGRRVRRQTNMYAARSVHTYTVRECIFQLIQFNYFEGMFVIYSTLCEGEKTMKREQCRVRSLMKTSGETHIGASTKLTSQVKSSRY